MPHRRCSGSLFAVAFACALALPAQEADPALATIRGMLEEAARARAEGAHEDAREVLRAAMKTCLDIPGFAERKDAHLVLFDVGRAAQRAEELRVAHAAYERVCTFFTRTLRDDHPALQLARENLGVAKRALGDLRGALALFEKVVEVRSRTLPDDHPALQTARRNLGVVKRALGDLEGACSLDEKVYQVWSRSLPDDHPDLQAARENLGIAKHGLGDLPRGRALLEKVFEVRSRTLPDDDPALQRARGNLAAMKSGLGDLAGARELQEKVFEVQSRTLPDDHPDLQAARSNLANTKRALGDLVGACALAEKVLEVRSRTLPDDHPDLQAARSKLAATKSALGDVAGARALDEKVFDVQSRTLPDDHPDLQRVRNNLALRKRSLGDLQGSLALLEKVFEVFSRTLPDDHPDLQRARLNLAAVKKDLADLRGARGLEVRAYEVSTRTLPDDHPDLQAARNNLSLTKRAFGDAPGTLQLARERAAAARRRLSIWTLAPRELGVMAAQEREGIDLLLTLAGGFGAIEPQPAAAVDALALSQTLRGAQTRAARRARVVDPARAAPLATALRVAAAEVSRVAGESLEGEGEVLEAKQRDRAERLSRAVHEKEHLERALLALAAAGGHFATASAGAGELAAALPERSAAAAIVGFTHAAPDPEHPGRTIDEARLAALVLARDGTVVFRPLGARAAIEELVTALRAQVGAGRERGLAPVAGEDPLATQKALRARVLDPILAAAGDVDTLWISVDEALELVPLDALARDNGTPLGSTIALRPLVSLFDLLEPPGAKIRDEPALLAIGGLDYDAADESARAVLGDAATPVTEDTRSGRPEHFRKLLDSSTEVRTIADTFGETFAGSDVALLRKTDGTKDALLAAAPKATFVHLATHGYFAPESVKSTADAPSTHDAFGETAVTGLSPLALCGLALSGANLPADALGRHAGILTAEEILSLDLSRCYLVTLSACDTSLGVRRAGQGHASLRAALQGAGARYVLTSLWKVGDEATMELMVDFYRRIWVQKKEPHQALWEAKMAARAKGAAFRDWAGWVLTGR
jgi:CHAT domain-containing protein